MDRTIRIETDDRGVATLWLARPDKHNALSGQMIAELRAAAERLGSDAGVRVIVLAGEGKSFCAGGDLGWMKAQIDADRETRYSEASALAGMLGALNEIPKPLIGRVHGNAFGGGVGMMAVCDTVFAADDARFGLTETRLGLIPATIGPYVLARVGVSKARRVFMNGALFGTGTASDLGLVSQVVSIEDLDDAVEKEVAAYLGCAPGAVAAAKSLTLKLGAGVTATAVATSIDALVDQWETPEAQEGIAAFFEKRLPGWSVS